MLVCNSKQLSHIEPLHIHYYKLEYLHRIISLCSRENYILQQTKTSFYIVIGVVSLHREAHAEREYPISTSFPQEIKMFSKRRVRIKFLRKFVIMHIHV